MNLREMKDIILQHPEIEKYIYDKLKETFNYEYLHNRMSDEEIFDLVNPDNLLQCDSSSIVNDTELIARIKELLPDVEERFIKKYLGEETQRIFYFKVRREVQTRVERNELERLNNIDDKIGDEYDDLLLDGIDIYSRDKPFVFLNDKELLIGESGQTHTQVLNQQYEENNIGREELDENNIKYVFGHIYKDIAFINDEPTGNVKLCIDKLMENNIKKVYFNPFDGPIKMIAKK